MRLAAVAMAAAVIASCAGRVEARYPPVFLPPPPPPVFTPPPPVFTPPPEVTPPPPIVVPPTTQPPTTQPPPTQPPPGTPPGGTQNTPEPSSLVIGLLGSGFAGLYSAFRRKRQPAEQ
jgi:hypothetical protein